MKTIKYVSVDGNGRVERYAEALIQDNDSLNPDAIEVTDFLSIKGKLWNGTTWINDQDYVEPLTDRMISKSQFFDLFTDDELEDILDSRKSSKKLTAFVKRIEIDDMIDMNSARLQDGVQQLETMGLLATGRANEIING